MKVFKVILFSKESENENKLVKEFKIELGKSYLIGRNPEKTTITISEGTISRIHAELSYTADGKLFITDLNSANGTFVDGGQIEAKKQVKLDLNSKINLGESKFFLVVSESDTVQNSKPSSSKDLPKIKENNSRIRDKSKEKSVSSSSSNSSMDREKRRKSRDRYYRSRKYKRSEEKEVDRFKEKKGDRYRRRSHQKWKNSRSRSRKKLRSISRSGSQSRKNYKQKYDTREKENISLEKEKQKNSKDNEIKKEQPELNYQDRKIYERKESNRKSSYNRNKIESFEEKISEEMEKKKKFFDEFLKLKELESTDIKLKLPKLIDKQKLNSQTDKNEIIIKPNLTDAFKKLEENNQLKGLTNNSQGYTKHGNNNINIHRRKSFDYESKIDNKHDNKNKNYINGSS